MKDRLISLSLFLVFFGLYGFTSAPTLAPYRDAGEMVTVLKTFGVAHPPGYPLYTLLGRISALFPGGNPAYQLNLFSSLCAALALLLFFWTLKSWVASEVAVVSAIFIGLSHPFWELACVSEMYSLGVLWLAMLFMVYFVIKNEPFFYFLLGLGLGVRMDLLLLVPIFLFWSWRQKKQLPLISMGFAALLGSSIFLYLTIRSGRNPWIDWGNPDTLLATFASATRKSYSGTLDLLSLSYRKGENFGVNSVLFGAHLKNTLGWFGCVLVVLGIVHGYRHHKIDMMLLLTVFLTLGPVFLFLANMPPNPHAVAIIEAAYLFPVFVLGVFLAWGLAAGISTKWKGLVALGVFITLPLNFLHGSERSSKRNNYFIRDFIENVWRSCPPHATAVFHDDVQLFSLWTSQLLDRRRVDVSLIASGLSASPWYWDMVDRWPTKQTPPVSLKGSQGWKELLESSPAYPILSGYDVDFSPLTPFSLSPQGFLVEVSREKKEKTGQPSMNILKQFGLYRSRATYGETADFFSSDLISDQARAHHQQAFYYLLAKNSDAIWYFLRAAYLDDTFVRPWSDLGYFYVDRGAWDLAEKAYARALSGFETTMRLARAYKTLPDVVNGIRDDESTTLNQMGVVQERMGQMGKAREYYTASFQLVPNAQAHYNLAVTYWGRDWPLVIQHMEAASRLNPLMAEAKAYLERARQISGVAHGG